MIIVKVQIAELMQVKAVRDGRDIKVNPITQEEIAREIDIPQGTISRWAGNKVDRLDKRIMIKLCQYFDCEIGDLLKIDTIS